jgi:hypothetical protein
MLRKNMLRTSLLVDQRIAILYEIGAKKKPVPVEPALY